MFFYAICCYSLMTALLSLIFLFEGRLYNRDAIFFIFSPLTLPAALLTLLLSSWLRPDDIFVQR